jgi:hypothetical protein
VANYEINGNAYDKSYYLAGIYPGWNTLVKIVCKPKKTKRFKHRQEACRKDVESAFGVLQI